jgi:hypothetical protein
MNKRSPRRRESCFLEEENPMTASNRARFPLGQIVATPGALGSVPQTEITDCLVRHARGDWGDVCPEDREENEYSVDKHLRLLSVFHAGNGRKFWIITEADRSATTVLLPDEY